MRRYVFFFISFLHISSIIVSGQARWNQTYQSYIDQYKDMVIEGMLEYGVPVSIILAQGLLENGAGRGRLVLPGSSHSGAECRSWPGRTVSYDDDIRGERFCTYDSAPESLEDHCKFLCGRLRCRSLFSLDRSDYRDWAYELKRAGYATNPVHAQSLISLIELHELYEYNKAKSYDRFMAHHSGENSVVRGTGNGHPNSVQASGTHPINKYDDNYYVIVGQEDPFKPLSKELETSVGKLAKYNERGKHERLIPGEYTWLEKKQKKGPKELKKRPYHIRKSESLYDITQRYDIRLRNLIKKNKRIAERGLGIGDEVILY